jgi:hypothetical protein
MTQVKYRIKMNVKSINRITGYIILGLLVFSTACSPLVVIAQPTGGAPLPTDLPAQDINATLSAYVQQTIQAQTPTQTAATATSVPATATQTEVEQPSPESVPSVTECHDSAKYVSDDGLDGTTYVPNTPFTKTWTVKNTGSCTWDSSYLVYQISGAFMTQQPGYWIVPPGQIVAPGQTVNISIGMTSPVENGNYKSYWGLKKENGQLMPIQGGTNGNSFYVKIKVRNDVGVADGKVTDASIDIELEQGSGAVCTANSTYFVHAYITADGPATAAYEISSTAGQIAAGYFQDMNSGGLSPFVSGTVVFDQADTKAINLRFVGPYPYPDDITVVLRVNGGEFYNTKLSCQ